MPRLVIRVMPVAEIVEAQVDPNVPEHEALEVIDYWRKVIADSYRRSVNNAAFQALVQSLIYKLRADLYVEEEASGALKVTLTDEKYRVGTSAEDRRQ
jgi:hypothetical protein